MEILLVAVCITTLVIQSTTSEKYRRTAGDPFISREFLESDDELNVKGRTQRSESTTHMNVSGSSKRQTITGFDKAVFPQKANGQRNLKSRESPGKKMDSSLIQKQFLNRFDDPNAFSKSSQNLDSHWARALNENFNARKDNVKKLDSSFTWPTWSSKKEIYQNNRQKKNRKHLDSIDDYLGLDSKYHEMADRKYIHEHEGFFFPIHIPSNHEKDDNLIPLLLLLLLPLLLFAIIIPLNANLLSTLFLIMQNNGATTTAAQLAAATGRRRRDLMRATHPIVEERIMEALHKISQLTDF